MAQSGRAGRWVRLESVVQRKVADLPRFIDVPGAAVESLGLSGTTAVEVRLNDVDIGRRNLKRWGRDANRWFFDLTEAQCRAAGVDTGDAVALRLRLASTDPPEALERLITRDSRARARWEAMTESQRRMLADHVREAKRESTRKRRAEQRLLGRD